jgi:gluconokinase
MTPFDIERNPSAIIVMGISGAGKTTVGKALAAKLGLGFIDGDDLHPPSNIAKMRGGLALNDADRWPWLRTIAAAIDQAAASRTPVIIACSALKRSYRDFLKRGRVDIKLVFLTASRDILAHRMEKRVGHFMPVTLLDSQLLALEMPAPDEDIIQVETEESVERAVKSIIAKLEIKPTVN